MNRNPVSSSNVKSVGYDSESSRLEVEFHHGGIYQYYGVPESAYRALMSAGSAGSYLAQNTKGVYRYSQVG